MSAMLRINDKTYLKVSCIEAVESESDGIYIYTSTSKFKTDLPIWQVINIIDLQQISEDVKDYEPKQENS